MTQDELEAKILATLFYDRRWSTLDNYTWTDGFTGKSIVITGSVLVMDDLVFSENFTDAFCAWAITKKVDAAQHKVDKLSEIYK